MDLGKCGVFRYAADPSTLPLMLAYGNDSGNRQWVLPLPHDLNTIPACPADLRDLIADPRIEFHAHNAGFEVVMWDLICQRRWGWPVIPHARWTCTAARAAAANQPRSLDKVAKRLKLTDTKDARGKFLIKALSLPTKTQKTYMKARKDDIGQTVKDENGRVVKDVNTKSAQYLEEQGIQTFPGPCKEARYFFNEDPDLMQEFRDYNIQDIVVEKAVHDNLPDPHEAEPELWQLDLAINWRGIPLDLDLCRGAMDVVQQATEWANSRLAVITDEAVNKVTQRQRIVDWLNTRYNFGSSLTEDVVEDTLARDDLPAGVREVLDLRRLAGGTAVGKYKAAVLHANRDGRCRGQLLYYGATTTGRWSGRGIQPHNFKREKTLDEAFITAVKSGSFDAVSMIGELSGKTVFEILKGCLRGMICAPEGKKLILSDFAGIESRVLNWICENEVKLDLFRRGQDAYIHTALDVYKVAYDDIATWNGEKWKIKKEHSEKRQIGKVCELGLGYGMGWRTFQINAANAGSVLDDAFANMVVNTWREANPQIPAFWNRIQNACWHVVKQKNPRVVARVGRLRVFYDPRDYLCIQLPSGRLLRYFGPKLMKDRRPDASGKTPWRLFYADGGKTGFAGNYGLIDTYGGKLCENIVQAIARDLLVNSMFIIHRADLPIIFHVHDEVVVEVDEDDSTAFDTIHMAMETLPPWAAGLPLEAETTESRRFTK